MARADHSDAQHRWTASSTAAAPRMLRYVSCCPAADIPGRSSAVAEDRTATATSSPRAAYARTIAAAVAAGIARPANNALIRSDATSNVTGSDTSTVDMAAITG